MNIKSIIWTKMLVKTFYREHAGFFLFVFLVFFGVVQPSAQLYFHYALIRGILETPAFLALVAGAWTLYGLRIRRFILQALEAPEALFLYKANALPPLQLTLQCARASAILLAPVAGYAAIIVVIALTRKTPGKALEIAAYITALTAAITWELRRRLRYPGTANASRTEREIARIVPRTAGEPVTNTSRSQSKTATDARRSESKTVTQNKKNARRNSNRRIAPYGSILLQFILTQNKGVTAAVKIFSVGMLYLLLRLQTPEEYDLRMPFLVFSLAIFGHGILLFRCRQLENTRLIFYKALPVSTISRATQYAIFAIALLLPELMLLGWLTPHPIKPIDAAIFAAGGYGLLLSLNAILLARTLTAAEYLKICLVLFGVLYVVVLKVWG